MAMSSTATALLHHHQIQHQNHHPQLQQQQLNQYHSHSASHHHSQHLQSGADFVFTVEQVGVLCEVLQRHNLIERLAQFLWTIPPLDEYRYSESVLKAQALISFHRHNFKKLYAILQSHNFSPGHHAELQDLWMRAHYAEIIKFIMASRRRAIGVGAVHKNKDIQAKFQEKGNQLAGEQLKHFSDQLDSFTTKLEEFAHKHREEIRRNAQFRRYFQEMCVTVGVDPLASSKGFWTEKLGFGNFYYELAIQIIEVCMSTSHMNGGLITVDELRNRLLRSRSKTRKEPISHDDVIRAVKKLKVLGHGFELHTLGGDRFLVQSVPGELSLDDTRVLQLAEETGGYVSRELICDQLRWDGQRANRVLERLVKGEMAWLDGQSADATVQYWFPSLFLEQQFSIGGGGNNNNNVLGMGGAGSESASMLSASVSLK